MTSKEDDRKPTDEERGWEDWDEDSRRALGKSHERTMGTLEDASIVSTVTRSPRTSPPNTRDPKDQILPSDLELNLQEQEAKRRMSIDDSSISKERKRVFTRRCMIIATVVLVCVCSVAVGTALLPSGALGGKTVVKVTGDVEETAANIGRAVTAYVRSAANFIGNEVKPAQDEKDSDGLGFLLPDYAFASLVEKLKIEGYQMPDYTGLYSSTREPVIDVQPVLWMTERSGSKSLKDILTYCARLVLSGDAAIGHETADTLEIFSSPDNTGHFANVNTETMEGLIRAQKIGVVDSELIHVVATPFIAEASSLFVDKIRTGRIFGMLRDPVQQAHSVFLTRKSLPTDHPDRLPEDMSLSQFAESERLVANPLTKALANTTDDTVITDAHVFAAKKVLSEKILVGIVDHFDESVKRFVNYYGFNIHDPVCVANFESSRDHRNDHEKLEESSHEYKTLADRNWADLEVFEFARSIVFPNQKGLIGKTTL